MDHAFIQKRLASCRAHLMARQIAHDEPVLMGEDPDDCAVFSLKLEGKLALFDIALLENGMTALRQVDPDDDSRVVLAEQAVPEFIVDLAKDLEVGFSCSHLQIHY